MTASEYIAFLMTGWMFMLPQRLKSENQFIRQTALVCVQEIALLKQVAAQLQHPDEMTGMVRRWYCWIEEITAIYNEINERCPSETWTDPSSVRRRIEALTRRDEQASLRS